MARIQWFSDQDSFTTAASGLQSAILQDDRAIAAATTVRGYCTACARPAVFKVHNNANLREGLFCDRCGLTARQRLVHLALREETAARTGPLRGAILERTTRLYRMARRMWPWLIGSEFLGPNRRSGQSYWWSTHWWRWRRTRHESITAFSYASQSLDLLAHSDVLEHVYDTGLALGECARVLRKGGAMLFTAPFFVNRAVSTLRGRPLPNGDIEHIESPEYHGDGVRHGGIYTFHNFGWSFFNSLRDAGFSRVEIGLYHAPDEGFTASNPNAADAWMALPTLFRATK